MMQLSRTVRQKPRPPLPSAHSAGPALSAWVVGSAGGSIQLLTDSQRRQLMRIAEHETVRANATIYSEHAPAEDVFIVHEGIFKAFREFKSGKRRVAAFLFPRDLFGLADKQGYFNTVQAVTPASFYRIPIAALRALLTRDAELEFLFLCKVTQALRVSQRRSMMVGRKDALGKLATFLTVMQKHLAAEKHRGRIVLPMTRSDIADYLALTPEAVSRAARRLIHQGVVAFDGRRSVCILDPFQLQKIVENQ